MCKKPCLISKENKNMAIDSFVFIVLFSIVTMIYQVNSIKYRELWSVIVSYYFYTCWHIRDVFILFGVTCVTYIRYNICVDFKRKLNILVRFILNCEYHPTENPRFFCRGRVNYRMKQDIENLFFLYRLGHFFLNVW